jgi:hypothetical protein
VVEVDQMIQVRNLVGWLKQIVSHDVKMGRYVGDVRRQQKSV